MWLSPGTLRDPTNTSPAQCTFLKELFAHAPNYDPVYQWEGTNDALKPYMTCLLFYKILTVLLFYKILTVFITNGNESTKQTVLSLCSSKTV